MKLKNIWQLLLLASVFIFQACEDDTEPRLDVSSVKLTTNPLAIEEFEVTSQNLSTEAFQVTWEGEIDELNLDVKTAYLLQIDVAGNDFKYAKTLASTKNKEALSVNAKDLNKFLVTEFAQAYDTKVAYEVRVALGVEGHNNIVNAIAETATNSQPIEVTVIELKKSPLYVVGDGLVGWGNDPSNIGKDLQVLFGDNNDSDQKYSFTGFFNAGALKLITQAGDWGTAYGYEGGKLVFGQGDNIPGPEVGAEGIYTLNVDLSNLTVSLDKYEEAVTDHELVSLMGDAAKDWDVGLPMTQATPHIWVATNVELKVGELKFKSGGDWWGVDSKKAELPFAMAVGGDNIKVETAGTYYIAFNDITKHFVIIPVSELP